MFDIPTKIIKVNHDMFSEILTNEMNTSIILGKFPESMKLADASGLGLGLGIYRTVSILPNLSKVFERCGYKQLSIFFENCL